MAGRRLEEGRHREPSGSGKDALAASGLLRRAERRVAGLRGTVVRRRGGVRAWRVLVAIVGSVVIAVGAVLLVFPGPGWLVIFVGLGIWATEFAWARSLLGYAQRQVGKWTAWIAGQRRATVLILGGAALMLIGLVVWLLLV